MITLRLAKDYSVPTRWSELTPQDRDKFVSLCMALQDFETGAIDIDTYRYRAALALTGVDVSKVKKFNDNISETIYRISELTGFSLDIRPDENGQKVAYTDISLSRNLLPAFWGVSRLAPSLSGGWIGYRFNVSESGIVDCDITAAQYVDAVQLVDTYSKTRDKEALDMLFHTLYRPDEHAIEPGYSEKVAVYYNLRGILDFVKSQPDYRIIFAKTGTSESSMPQSPLGLGASMFSLSKAGYGDIESIKKLDMFTYLGALVQMSVDSILTLKASRLKPQEISEKLNLPIEFILPYFQES